jgi:hypothetical protein
MKDGRCIAYGLNDTLCSSIFVQAVNVKQPTPAGTIATSSLLTLNSSKLPKEALIASVHYMIDPVSVSSQHTPEKSEPNRLICQEHSPPLTLNSSKLPKEALMASAMGPVGAPPALGASEFQ